MQLHQIQRRHNLQKKHRVGRGGKKGTYSGRGIKGQSARAGAKFKPIIRGLIKRYPKLRGYRVQRAFPVFQIVSLQAIEKAFKAHEVVSPASLLERHMTQRFGGKLIPVKILAGGEITKALTFEGCRVSKNAKTSIEKAGGAVSV